MLRAVHDKVEREAHAGAAVLAVARKLVAYLMAVDKGGKPFQVREANTAAAAPEALSSPTGSASPSPPPVGKKRVAQRSSPSRVRVAAPKSGAPLTTAMNTTVVRESRLKPEP